MIDKELIKNKFESINNEIDSINDTYGEEVSVQLIERVEDTINQFLDDFKEKSSKSFCCYWDEQKKNKDRFDRNKGIKVNSDMKKDEITPKFISEYKNKK